MSHFILEIDNFEKMFIYFTAGTQELCAAGGSYGIAVEVASFTDFIKAKAKDGEFCADD